MNDITKFHKLTPQECREMYASNLIDAAGYILLIIKTHGAAGWKWGISAREFCLEWGIKIRTFYVAIKRLVAKGLIEAKRRSDILLSYKTVPDVAVSIDAHTYSPDCTPAQRGDILVQRRVHSEPETLVQQEFQNLPDSSQTSSDFQSEEEQEQTAPCGGAVCQEEEIKELSEEELAIAFHQAEKGIKPSQSICDRIRDTKYATAFVAIARLNGWDLSQGEGDSQGRQEATSFLENLKRRFRS